MLPYVAMAALFRGHLWTGARLWAVFTGRRTLVPPAWHSDGAQTAGQTGAAGAAGGGDSTLAFPPSLPDLTASILLGVPVLLLLPTVAVFYGFACCMHVAWLVVRLAAALGIGGWQGAPVSVAERGEHQHPRTGAGFRWMYLPVGSTLGCFAAGRLVGVHPAWPVTNWASRPCRL